MNSIAVHDNIILVSKGLFIDCYDGKKHTTFNLSNKDSQNDDKISDIVISPDKRYFAAITSTSKRLILYNISTMQEERIFILPRSASKIRFTVNNKQILVADKTGDGLIYNILSEDSGSKLLGHLSLLLNILQTNDGKFIITSDRDEKIRVTCYPNSYSIHTYCMGHKEFVNNLELLPHNEKILLSTSGDGTIKCWNYENGTLCYTIDVCINVNAKSLQEEFKKCMDEEGVEIENLPIVNFTVTGQSATCSILAVSLHTVKKIILFSLESENDKLKHKLIDILDLNDFPLGIKIQESSLFVYFANYDLFEFKLTYDQMKWNVIFVKNIDTFTDIKTSVSIGPNTHDHIKVLYKRRFDNVQEYQERKKQRLGIVT